MKAIATTVIVWLVLTTTALADPPPGWILAPALSDEFGGTTIDPNKWNLKTPGWGQYNFDPGHVAIGDGLLRITATYDTPARGWRHRNVLPYTTALVASTATVRYGYFEARIKAAPLYPGVSNGLWFWRDDANAPWGVLARSEIDVCELCQDTGNSAKLSDSTAFIWRYGPYRGWEPPPVYEFKKYTELSFDPRDDFHVYGLLWTPDSMTWFVDGAQVASMDAQHAKQFTQALNLALDLEIREPVLSRPTPHGFPTTMEVDWVRSWQPPKGWGP